MSIPGKAEYRLRTNKILDLWKLMTNNRNIDINEIQAFEPNKHVAYSNYPTGEKIDISYGIVIIKYYGHEEQ